MARKSGNRKKSGGSGGPPRSATSSSPSNGPSSPSGNKKKRPKGGGGGGPTRSLPTAEGYHLAAALPVCLLLVSGLYRSFGPAPGPGGGSDGEGGRRRDGTATSTDDRDAAAAAPPREVAAAAAAFDVHEGCTLYYAPSSIPRSGLGVYTTAPRDASAEIGEPDVLVNLFDASPPQFKDHVWGIGRRWDIGEASKVGSLLPGLPMLSNSHPHLRNVALSGIEHSAGLDRARHPGAGSFTLYRGVRNKVRKRVEAGEEIFHDYGDTDKYLVSRYEKLGTVPLRKEWEEVDRIVRAVQSFLSKHGDDVGNDGGTHDEWADDLWKLIRRDGEYTDGDKANVMATHLIRSHPPVRALLEECQFTDPRISMALPRSVSDLAVAAERGAARWSLPDSVRSVDWIKDNGRCIDHLRPGSSTIQGAGVGAFAKHPIPKGGIIGSSPLFHVTNSSVLESYTVARDPSGTWTPGPDRTSRQLLWNYCLGHPRSTLVLIPYGPMVNLINHASVRNNGSSQVPNAEVRWSNRPSHRSEWTNLAASELEDETHGQGGLQIDYVATKDVEPGDEIFIDYGENWDRAWIDHVRGWLKSPPGPRGYKSAQRLNQEKVPILTADEQRRERSYPDNVQFGCHYVHGSDAGDDDENDENAFRWKEAPRVWDEGKHLHPCKILSRRRISGESSEELYDALVVDRRKAHPNRIVKGLPRRAVTFIEVPYTSDQHMARAFRHLIELPDEMFPEAWKNA